MAERLNVEDRDLCGLRRAQSSRSLSAPLFIELLTVPINGILKCNHRRHDAAAPAVNIEGIYKELWRVSVKGSLTNTGMLSNHNFNDCWC